MKAKNSLFTRKLKIAILTLLNKTHKNRNFSTITIKLIGLHNIYYRKQLYNLKRANILFEIYNYIHLMQFEAINKVFFF